MVAGGVGGGGVAEAGPGADGDGNEYRAGFLAAELFYRVDLRPTVTEYMRVVSWPL